jgi:hypothetical protein
MKAIKTLLSLRNESSPFSSHAAGVIEAHCAWGIRPKKGLLSIKCVSKRAKKQAIIGLKWIIIMNPSNFSSFN